MTVALAVALATGCADGSSDAVHTSTAPTRTTTTSTVPTTAPPATSTVTPTTVATDPVLSAYLAFWDLYRELGGKPPPFDPAAVTPRLDELTTGAERTQLFNFLQNNAATGLVLRGDLDHAPSVVSNDGTVAVVKDCMDDRLGVYRVADNTRVDNDNPNRQPYTVLLRHSADRWRVETVKRGAEPCTV
jgi:hypothetical protein